MSSSAAVPKALGTAVIPETTPLTKDQEKLVTEFVKNFLEPDNTPPTFKYLHSTNDDNKDRDEESRRIVAYKFLIARKFKMEDAVQMFKESCYFRETNGNNHIRPMFPSPVVLRGYDELELMKFFQQYGGDNNPSAATSAATVVPRVKSERIDFVCQRLYGSYSNSIHKWDKQGHPVAFEMIGAFNVPQGLKAFKEMTVPNGNSWSTTNTTPSSGAVEASSSSSSSPASASPSSETSHFSEPVIEFRTFETELLQKLMRYNDERFASTINKESGRRVTSFVSVMDCEKVNMSMVTSETLELLKRMLQLDQKIYPEVLHRMIIINVTPIVMMVYNIVKVVLDPRVREKFVFVYPEDVNAVLKALIDEENLPKRYGGKCDCPGGCIFTDGQKEDTAYDADSPDGFHETITAKTEEIEIGAGDQRKKHVHVKSGRKVMFTWESATDHDVDFEVHFRPREKQKEKECDDKKKQEGSKDKDVQQHHHHHHHHYGAATSVIEKQRIKAFNWYTFTTPSDGEVTLLWCNKHSYFKGKTIRFRAFEVKDKDKAKDKGGEKKEKKDKV